MDKKYGKTKKVKLIAIAITGLFITWFVLPNISIYNYNIFSLLSVRLILTLLLSGCIINSGLYAHKLTSKGLVKSALTQISRALNTIKVKTWSLISWSKNATKTFKPWLEQKKERIQWKRNPFILFLGEEQSGKTALLNNSNQMFFSHDTLSEHEKVIQKQLDGYLCYFNDKATFITLSIQNKKNKSNHIKRLTRVLIKSRLSKPLNSVVITIPLANLLIYSHEQRQEFINNIANDIRGLSTTLNIELPVYIIFTKVDEISGFTVFFNDLSQEELTQIWGITFSISSSSNPELTLNECSKEFTELTSRLENKVLYTLDTQKTTNEKSLVHTFPQQIKLFKKPILTLISELFSSLKLTNALIRGIYMTSSEQNSRRHDFLYSTLCSKFSLRKSYQDNISQRNEPYFISELFHNILLKEGMVFGENKKIQRSKKYLNNTIGVLISLTLTYSCIGMCNAYVSNNKIFKHISKNINQYDINKRQLKENNSELSQTLPCLDSLRNSYESLNQSSLFDRLLLTHNKIKTETYQAMLRAIHMLFIPRIAATLESQLSNPIRKNTNTLYVLLKGYLAFDNNKAPENIIVPIVNDWIINGTFTKEQSLSLRYFTGIVSEAKLDSLPLDHPLIDKIRLQLQQVDPAHRAYALLEYKARTSNVSDIKLNDLINLKNSILKLSPSIKRNIESLFTMDGYNKIYLKNHSKIASLVAKDNNDVGLNFAIVKSKEAIDQSLRESYSEGYSAHWLNILKNISIEKTDSYDALIKQLSVLSSTSSPLKQLLDLVYDNTHSLNNSGTVLDSRIRELNAFTNNKNTHYNYNNTRKLLSKVLQNITLIKESDQPGKGFFELAKKVIGDKTTVLNKLEKSSEHASEPLKGWLKSITMNIWNQISIQATKYLNKEWKSKIYTPLLSNISSDYPFNMKSKTDVTVQSFNTLFKPNGLIMNFYNKQAQFFIKTDGNKWTAQKYGFLTPFYSSSFIHFLQLSKTLSETLFDQQGNIGFNFTLTPDTLDSKAKKIQIKLGGSSIQYQHGPQEPEHFKWPYNNDANISSISLQDFQDQMHGIVLYDQWGLFKLLTSHYCHITKEKNDLYLNINIEGFHSKFKLSPNTNLRTLTLSRLRNFYIPKQIGGLNESGKSRNASDS